VASHPLELERELNKSVKEGNSFYNSKLLMNLVTVTDTAMNLMIEAVSGHNTSLLSPRTNYVLFEI
jgi:hypothetical protein